MLPHQEASEMEQALKLSRKAAGKGQRDELNQLYLVSRMPLFLFVSYYSPVFLLQLFLLVTILHDCEISP